MHTIPGENPSFVFRCEEINTIESLVSDTDRLGNIIMEIERNAVYEHREYGDVVIVNIVRVYRNYDIDRDDGEIDSTQIVFSDEWDDYGAIPPTKKAVDIESFIKQVGETKRTIEFDS